MTQAGAQLAAQAGAQAAAQAGARAQRKAEFLALAGWGGAALTPLAGDASARSYDRVRDGARRAVLMDAPPARGIDTKPFLALTGFLRARGLSAPAALAADRAAGLVLLEDLGDDLFATICARDPGAETRLYAAAVDLLAGLHRDPPPTEVAGHAIPPYDMATLLREAALIVEWWAPAASGRGAARVEAFRAMVARAMAPVAAARGTLVLRDYHAENLIWLPGRAEGARVGLLDYQDALRGHPAYDLAGLLEDARRDVSPGLRAAMLARYAAATGVAPTEFAADFARLAAQRNLKIVGLFTRLWLQDGKPQYLALIPRVWAHLARDLAHPALDELRGFVAAHVPAPTPAALARVRGARS